MAYKKLIKVATYAKRHSFSPYSKFRVGAALMTKRGKIYSGCNIENSSFGLTICAERTALFKAISEGQKEFRALAISTDSKDYISPCGACRQVMMDLAGNIDVVLTKGNREHKILKLYDLLPHAFAPKNLKRI